VPKIIKAVKTSMEVAEEFMKLVTKGKYPGKTLELLKETGWLKNFPELEAMYGVPQEPEWPTQEPWESAG
jgi:hypothetical protein